MPPARPATAGEGAGGQGGARVRTRFATPGIACRSRENPAGISFHCVVIFDIYRHGDTQRKRLWNNNLQSVGAVAQALLLGGT